LAERVIAQASAFAGRLDLVDVEGWASGWLGYAWLTAATGEREPERGLCVEVVDRARSSPSPAALAAVTGLRRVAPQGQHRLLDEAFEVLVTSLPALSWSAAPPFEPVRAWRAVDAWESERVLLVDCQSRAAGHTLLAEIVNVAGIMVNTLSLLRLGAAGAWGQLREEAGSVPMPLDEVPVAVALTELADALRQTDLLSPRHDEKDFVALRALAWARCRAFVAG
jgi:hypothetical protein